MAKAGLSDRCCSNRDCPSYGQFRRGNIRRHGFFTTRRGRRRRYRCTTCGRTCCSSTGTPYYRLRCTRSTLDEVAAMTVEGLSKSSIARLKRIAWNTVACWQERAAAAARFFNDAMTRGYELKEIQADEIMTFTQGKSRPIWVFTTLEVWSRLWPSTVVGRRSYRNTRQLIRDTVQRGRFGQLPLISTDGSEYYAAVIGHILAPACVYGQVMKTRRNARVIKIERNLVFGSRSQLDDALFRSEDSHRLNTSFIERLNLTTRQGSAYLSRRSPCHARSAECLESHLELLRCYYNFIRVHSALRFGSRMRTPAMQAGLASRQLSFREVFMAAVRMQNCFVILRLVSMQLRFVSRRRAAA